MAWSIFCAVPALPTKPATGSEARGRVFVMKWFKIAVLIVVPLLAGTLIVLRVTGLDPGHPSSTAPAASELHPKGVSNVRHHRGGGEHQKLSHGALR